jgi:hypothetical protein
MTRQAQGHGLMVPLTVTDAECFRHDAAGGLQTIISHDIENKLQSLKSRNQRCCGEFFNSYRFAPDASYCAVKCTCAAPLALHKTLPELIYRKLPRVPVDEGIRWIPAI